MPARQDVLGDRRFWASLYAAAFGQIGEPPEPQDVCSRFGLSEQETLDCDHEFTGWHPGVFDEGDGFSEDPAAVRVALARGTELRVEFHPGDLYWFLGDGAGAELMLASVGVLKLVNVPNTEGAVRVNVLRNTGALRIVVREPVMDGVSVLTAGRWRAGKAGWPEIWEVV